MRAITRTEEFVRSGERVSIPLDLELNNISKKQMEVFPHCKAITKGLWIVDFDVKGKDELFAIVENKSSKDITLKTGEAILECI